MHPRRLRLSRADRSRPPRPFFRWRYLLLAQGLFAGLTIGKLTEGSIKKGIKHSFVLMISSFLVSTGARLFLVPAAA